MNKIFVSNIHVKYEGVDRTKSIGVGYRIIKIEPNSKETKGYLVSIYDLDGKEPVWQEKIHMAPKTMKLVHKASERFEFRGYGYDEKGVSNEDYGLSVYMSNDSIARCVIHIYSSAIELEYIKHRSDKIHQEPEFVILGKYMSHLHAKHKYREAERLYMPLYESVNTDLGQLGKVTQHRAAALPFLAISLRNVSDKNIDIGKTIEIGYLLSSLSIYENMNDRSYLDRAHLLSQMNILFIQLIIDIFNINKNFNKHKSFSKLDSEIEAVKICSSMIVSDFNTLKNVEEIFYYTRTKKRFDKLIEKKYFSPYHDINEIVNYGTENHKKVFEYLHNKYMK